MEKYCGTSLDYGAKLQKSIKMRKKVVELSNWGIEGVADFHKLTEES